MRTACPRSASAPSESGFTLIELMVVVIIISIVAVLAVPSLSAAGYDRRVFQDAASVAEIVREARTRAVGRGAAQLLAMTTNASTNTASFILYESEVGGMPIASCNFPTVWPGAGSGLTPTATFVDQYVFAGTVSGASTLEGQGNIIARVTAPQSTSAYAVVPDGTTEYLCFTPSGHVLWQTGASTSYLFQTMPVVTGAPNAVVVEVTRTAFPSGLYPSDTGSTDLVRAVVISPAGATRMTSQ